jgi:hypothetical protein
VSDTDSWCSPPEVTEPLVEFFDGPVGCDPCSNPRSIVLARKAYTVGGLHLPWGRGTRNFRTAYVNNPYSKSAPWIGKGLREIEAGNLTELLYLVMHVPSTTWWRTAMNYRRINPRVIVTPRLCFIDPKIKAIKATKKGKRSPRPTNARFDTALIYFGPRSRVRALDRAFANITSWSTWGRSLPA